MDANSLQSDVPAPASAPATIPARVSAPKANYDKLTPHQLKSLSSNHERVIVYHQSTHDADDRMVIDERIPKQLTCAFSPVFARTLSKIVKGGSVTITGGRRTGLQQIFKWIQDCGEQRRILSFPQSAIHPYTQTLTVRGAAMALEMEPIVAEMTARLPLILQRGIHSEDVLDAYVSGQDPAARLYATQHIAALAVEGNLPAFNVWDTLCQTNETFRIDLETCLQRLGTDFAQLREIESQRRKEKMHKPNVQMRRNVSRNTKEASIANKQADESVQDEGHQRGKQMQVVRAPASKAFQQARSSAHPGSGRGRGRGRGQVQGRGGNRGTGRARGYGRGRGQSRVQGQNKELPASTRQNATTNIIQHKKTHEPVRLEIKKKHGKKVVQPSLSELGIKKSMFLTEADLAKRRPPPPPEKQPTTDETEGTEDQQSIVCAVDAQDRATNPSQSVDKELEPHAKTKASVGKGDDSTVSVSHLHQVSQPEESK